MANPDPTSSTLAGPGSATPGAPSQLALLEQLERVIRQRREADPESSYVAALVADGDRVLQKLGEETTELILAVKTADRQQICHESADLLFHLIVMLAGSNLCLADVVAELEKRMGTSGITEKSLRRPKDSG